MCVGVRIKGIKQKQNENQKKKKTKNWFQDGGQVPFLLFVIMSSGSWTPLWCKLFQNSLQTHTSSVIVMTYLFIYLLIYLLVSFCFLFLFFCSFFFLVFSDLVVSWQDIGQRRSLPAEGRVPAQRFGSEVGGEQDAAVDVDGHEDVPVPMQRAHVSVDVALRDCCIRPHVAT